MKFLRSLLRGIIRPSTAQGSVVLWARSLLNALLFFAIFMFLLPWLAHLLVPIRIPIPPQIGQLASGLLALIGIVIWLACLDTFSRHGEGTPLPADAPRNLVTNGLFGLVRNPIMVGELLIIWAEALYFATLGIVLYALAISAAAHMTVVHVEEPELRERFGESYEQYCRGVPRWLPRLRRTGPAKS